MSSGDDGTLRARDVRASLPLEIALYFHGVYGPPFALLLLLLIVYKGASTNAGSADAHARRRPAPPPPPPPDPPIPAHVSTASELPYPSAALGLEIAFIFFYAILEYTRLLLGALGVAVAAMSRLRIAGGFSRGAISCPHSMQRRAATRPSRRAPRLWLWRCPSPLPSFTCTFSRCRRLCAWQRLRAADVPPPPSAQPPPPPPFFLCGSLRLDQVLNSIALAFVAAEVLFGVAATATFVHAKLS